MTDHQLNRSQRIILKKIKNIDKPTNSKLYQNEVINNLYSSERSLSTSIKRDLEEGKKYVESKKNTKNQKEYILTEKGERKLRKIVRRDNLEVTDDEIEIYDYSNAVKLFSQYWENEGQNELQKALGNSEIVKLDYKKLERFDPDLADDLLDNPEEVLEASEEAITDYPDVSDSIEIRVANIPEVETKEISALKPDDDLETLITVEGVLEASTRPKAELVEGIFECTNCASRYKKKQDSNTPKSPYKCECGSQKFEVVDLQYETVVMGRLKEKPGKQSRKTIPVKITGKLAQDQRKNLESTGQGFKVTGYLELFSQKKNADLLDMKLVANNIEVEENKWSDIEISDEERERIQDFRDQFDSVEELKDHLRDSLARERIAGMEKLKETFLVWYLGRDEDTNLHALIIGEPGLGKSDLADYCKEYFPRTIKSVGTGSTGVGLTAAVRKDELTGDYVAEAGALAQAHQGFHITDEVDKAKKEDLSKMNDALSDKSITLSKANIHTEIPADVSEMAMGNPKGSVFDPYEPVYKQVPLSKEDLLERFDLKLALKREDIQGNKEKTDEILDMMLGRSGSESSVEVSKKYLNKEDMKKYLALAQKYDPEIPESVKNKMKRMYHSLNNVETDPEKDSKTLFGPRRFSTLIKLSKAYARVDFSDKVEKIHLQMAATFLKECYETMDFKIGRDSFDDISTNSNMDNQKVRMAIENLQAGNGANVQDVIDEVDVPEEKAEKIIEQLKNDGEFFDSAPGKVKAL